VSPKSVNAQRGGNLSNIREEFKMAEIRCRKAWMARAFRGESLLMEAKLNKR
jgi:hypothetical protein